MKKSGLIALFCWVLPQICEMSIQLLVRFCSLCFIRLRSRAKAFALLLFVVILLIAGIASIRKQTRVPMSKPWVGSPICEILHIAPCSFFFSKNEVLLHLQVMTPCHSNTEAASIQKSLLLDTEAKCNNAGVCFCADGKYFDGRKCLTLAGR
jgi:hypothetical protein